MKCTEFFREFLNKIMCDKNMTTSKNKKLYLATFEFISGEFGQIFLKTFYVKHEESLKKSTNFSLIIMAKVILQKSMKIFTISGMVRLQSNITDGRRSQALNSL